MNRVYVVFILLALSGSCNNRRLKNELALLANSKIELPCQLLVLKGTDQYYINEISSPIKLIIYYDSQSCSLCMIAHLSDYQSIYDISKKFHSQFQVIPIFASSLIRGEETKTIFKSFKVPDVIYIDNDDRFMQLNPLLDQSGYNIFLLDKNNRIVLIGDPLQGGSMLELYKSTLDNMLAHDGLYVPEK